MAPATYLGFNSQNNLCVNINSRSVSVMNEGAWMLCFIWSCKLWDLDTALFILKNVYHKIFEGFALITKYYYLYIVTSKERFWEIGCFAISAYRKDIPFLIRLLPELMPQGCNLEFNWGIVLRMLLLLFFSKCFSLMFIKLEKSKFLLVSIKFYTVFALPPSFPKHSPHFVTVKCCCRVTSLIRNPVCIHSQCFKLCHKLFFMVSVILLLLSEYLRLIVRSAFESTL